MSTRYCPQCHQPLGDSRLGVRLPAIKLAIFDVIHNAGADGVPIQTIAGLVFGQGMPEVGIRSHVYQINQLLYGTGFRIEGGGWNGSRGYYRLVDKSYHNHT
jgi:hypothetical protein